MTSEFNVNHPYPGKIIKGPVSVYGIAELNRRAEEATLKVRGELSRIGCSADKMMVSRQGIYLLMKFSYQVILADPYEVLMVLKKTPVGLSESEVWERINGNVRNNKRQTFKISAWAVGALALVTLAVSLVLFFAKS